MCARALTVNVNGKDVRLTDCEWVLYNPAEFPVACMHADSRSQTPEQAMRTLATYRDESPLALAMKGYSVELMTRAQWAAEVMPVMRGDVPATQPLNKEKWP